MAFAAAGVAGRAAAGRAAGGAAARGTAAKGASKGAARTSTKAASKGAGKGSSSAFGTKARAVGDPELAEELAALNADDPAPAPEPAPEPEQPSGGGGGGGNIGSPGTGAKAAWKKLSTPSAGTPGFYRDATQYASPTVALNAGGGALLGLVAYAVALTYLRGGRDGVKALVRAKFLNQTTTGPAAKS